MKVSSGLKKRVMPRNLELMNFHRIWTFWIVRRGMVVYLWRKARRDGEYERR